MMTPLHLRHLRHCRDYLAYLAAPVSYRMEISFPNAAIAAASAAGGGRLRRVAEDQAALRKLFTKVPNPLSCLLGIGWQGVVLIAVHRFRQ